MKIEFNDERLEVEKGLTLQDLASQRNIRQARGLVIAVNDEVLSADRWAGREIQENDRIVLFGAIQGG